jgi:hypothetical protein
MDTDKIKKNEWTGLTGLTRFFKQGFNPVNHVNPVYFLFLRVLGETR